MPSTQPGRRASTLLAVSNALTALHREQFGCEPATARSHFAGPDTLVCVLRDALLPAERAIVRLGGSERVRESRGALAAATSQCFVDAIELIVGRPVYSFAGAVDAEHAVVTEVFIFETSDGLGGERHHSIRAEAAALVRESGRMREENAEIRRSLDAMRQSNGTGEH